MVTLFLFVSIKINALSCNGRRQKVFVKLNTPILVILEEVCKKQKLNPAEYDLKFHNRILDITSTIQFLGITNNAQVELVPAAKPRVDSPVTIFLQLENGKRLSGSFLPTQSLWDVISALCDEEIKSKVNPVIIYTRQEVFGDKLRSTSLKMLGLTGGNALLRLLHRTEDQLRNQCVSSIYKLPPKVKPVVERVPEKSEVKSPEIEVQIEETLHTSPMDVDMPSKNIDSTLQNNTTDVRIENEAASLTRRKDEQSETLKMIEEPLVLKHEEIETEKTDTLDEQKISTFDINQVEYIGERYTLIFHADSLQSPRFNEFQEDDDFYELTIEDAKALLRDIKRTRSELEQADLETSESKARRKSILLERTMSIYPHCVVRILFPNRIILQAVFKSDETILDVIQFTKSFVEDSVLNFYLYTSPPKRILKAEQSLIDIGAVPGINLYFGRDEADRQHGSIIRPEFLNRMTSPNVALEVANHFRRSGKTVKRETVETASEPSSSTSSVDASPAPRSKPTEHAPPKKPAGGAVPKWFKTR